MHAGRVDLLRGDLDAAEQHLATAVALAEREHWLSFLPWPQAFQGEVWLARRDPSAAAEILQQAFARACQLGDPCWEGISRPGAGPGGRRQRGYRARLQDPADARARSTDSPIRTSGSRPTSSTRCATSAAGTGIPTPTWVDTMRDLASRTGMRELIVRALLHSAAQGGAGDAEAAGLLATQIDNPALHALVRDSRN